MTAAEKAHFATIKAWVIALNTQRRMTPDSILLQHIATPSTVKITLLAYACCHPSVHISKPILSITQDDVAQMIAPILQHAH